jgi:hypothetical protein
MSEGTITPGEIAIGTPDLSRAGRAVAAQHWMYRRSERWPNGPPSLVTRGLSDVPTLNQKLARCRLFFEPSTGLGFIVTGFLLQLVAVWLAP